MIVCSGRLRGASTFGCVRSSVNSAPRFCSGNPVPSATTPDPKLAKLLCMSDTMLPSRSTTERYVVSPPPSLANMTLPSSLGAPGATCACARAGSISAARSRAYSLLSIAATGTVRKCRIGDMPLHVGVRELLCLDQHVERIRGVVRLPCRSRKRLHDVQHHQRRDAGAVRRQLEDLPTAVSASKSDRPTARGTPTNRRRPSSSRAARGPRRGGARSLRDRTRRRRSRQSAGTSTRDRCCGRPCRTRAGALPAETSSRPQDRREETAPGCATPRW